jgi:hypothetical protein
MKYIVEAQTLIKIEVDAESEQEAYEKATDELEDVEDIDWSISVWKKERIGGKTG